MARVFGLEVQILTPGEARERWPLLAVDDVVGAVYLPKDGRTNPVDTTQALARGARNGGARIVEGVRVSGIRRAGGRVTGVTTDAGEVRADVVVNCAGMWGREVGALAGVNVPLHAAEHFYIVTEAIPGLPSDLPVLRDADACSYFKEDAGKLLVGWFEPRAKPWGENGIPHNFAFEQLPPDLAHIEPLFAGAMRRVPVLESTGVQAVLQRPGELHARRPLPARRGAGAAWLLRGCGLQLHRHPVGGRRRQGARGLDRRRPPADGSLGRRHPPLHAVPAQPQVPARPHGGGARTALRHALAVPPGRERARRAHAPRSTTASPPRAPASARWRAGSAPTGSAPRAARRTTSTATGGRTGSSCRPRSTARCANRVGLFDQSSFAQIRASRGAMPAECSHRICANDVDVPVGTHRLHALAE